MKNLTINLAPFPTQDGAIEAAKLFLLEHGYTIIQHSPRYFDYMKDNRFGHFSVASHFGYSLSSVYKPSRTNGTGAQGTNHEFTFSLAQFQGVLDQPGMGIARGKIELYKDLDEFLASKHKVWLHSEIEVIEPESIQ